MTERPDPVDLLLAQSCVPALAPDLAERIVTDAQRPGRIRATAPPRRPWRGARRGAWTAVIAINIVLASAVAAAIGGAGRYLPAPIASVTHHLVERLRAHLPLLPQPARHHPPAGPVRPRSTARPPAPPIRMREAVRPLAAPAMVHPFAIRPVRVERPRALMRPLARHDGRVAIMRRHPSRWANGAGTYRQPAPLWHPRTEQLGRWPDRPPPAWREPGRRRLDWGDRPRWRSGRLGRIGPGPFGRGPRGGRRFR